MSSQEFSTSTKVTGELMEHLPGKKMEQLWTVVRFPNGSWSYGGEPTDPDYGKCEIWQIEASSAETAVKKAQAKRSRDCKKSVHQ